MFQHASFAALLELLGCLLDIIKLFVNDFMHFIVEADEFS
jgi:hypothetical protein